MPRGGLGAHQPAFAGFESAKLGTLFPFLSATAACGACSGFHGLVCSGTTSKQIAREDHCKPIGYGAMLLEGFVAVIALGTIMIATSGEVAGKKADEIYSLGLGQLLTSIIGPDHARLAATVAVAGPTAHGTRVRGLGQFPTPSMGPALARFAPTSAAFARSTAMCVAIDVGPRLGRYVLRELFRWEGRAAAMIWTGLTV